MSVELVRPEQAYLAAGPSAPVLLDDSPSAEIRAGAIIAGLFFLLFLGWASVTRLDAAAVATGRVAVSGQRQTVQHRDGGVVGRIFVREGQKVARGAVLLQLAAAEVQAQERALSSQAITLLAQRARLRSEQLGQATVATPPEFATLTGDDRIEAEQAMRLQMVQLRARSSLLSTQQGVLGSERAQVGQQRAGYQRQLTAIKEQERLLNEELDAYRPVAEKGFVALTRLRAMERAAADLAGQRGRLEASIAEAGEGVGESQLKIVETQRSLQEKIAEDLHDTEARLSDVVPRLTAARDQLSRTMVRAPVSGTVVGLSVFTEGGVIAPGQRLMDIVPDNPSLVVEARVSPLDVDDLRVGQQSTVRFNGLQERDLPTLHGAVRRISADALTDEKTGVNYYVAEVSVPPDQVLQIQDVRGADFRLKPGMPVEILVPLRKRTALQYFFEPLTEAMWRSFREH